VSVCLSVCLVSKQLKVSSKIFHHLIAPWF